MRELARFDNPAHARTLLERLAGVGIEAELRERSVWVLDDRELPRAKQELDALATGQPAKPSQPSPPPPASKPTPLRGPASTWRAEQALGVGPLTIFLIVASVLVGFASDFGDATTMTIQNLSIQPWQPDHHGFLGHVRAGEVWRLVTPMLIHFGVIHLLFNAMWVWQLGRQIEHEHGSLVMLGLVLLGQIPSGLGQYLATGPSFGGLSGVAYALFGFVWMHARFDRRRSYAIEDSTVVIMMIWLVACATGLLGPVANVGHAFGLLAGLLAGLPAYRGHLRAALDNQTFGEHGYGRQDLRGSNRFVRMVLRPYAPLWMLALALAVALAEFMGMTGGH